MLHHVILKEEKRERKILEIVGDRPQWSYDHK